MMILQVKAASLFAKLECGSEPGKRVKLHMRMNPEFRRRVWMDTRDCFPGVNDGPPQPDICIDGEKL